MADKIIYSVLKKIALEAFDETPPEIVADFFSPQEQTEIADKQNRTKAGMVVAKKALSELLMSVTSLFDIAEKDIVISHKPNGAPYIVSLPPLPNTVVPCSIDHFSISISHTQNTAYAIAAYQGITDE